MKVNDPNTTAISGLGNTQSASPTSHQQRARSGRAGRNDQIDLSSLSQALAALQANSPQRDARLGQLSSAVSGDSYVIDPNVISGSLIRETLAAGAR